MKYLCREMNLSRSILPYLCCADVANTIGICRSAIHGSPKDDQSKKMNLIWKVNVQNIPPEWSYSYFSQKTRMMVD
jgi:hypothetical protein